MRVAFLLLFSVVTFAQQSDDLFEKAPPNVDEALRARITEFYQYFVDGKFRDADGLVADDSKDIFFEMEKSRIRGFDILRIVYSDEFTKAKAVVAIDRDMGALGTRFRVKAPISSLWRLESGKWCWYAVHTDELMTPNGPMRPGPMPDESKAVTITHGPQVAALHTMVRADRTEMSLSLTNASSDSAQVVSSLPGRVDLSLDDVPVPGLQITLSRNQISKGEPATITFRYTPSDKNKPPTVARVRLLIRQTNDAIWFNVRFKDAATAAK